MEILAHKIWESEMKIRVRVRAVLSVQCPTKKGWFQSMPILSGLRFISVSAGDSTERRRGTRRRSGIAAPSVLQALLACFLACSIGMCQTTIREQGSSSEAGPAGHENGVATPSLLPARVFNPPRRLPASAQEPALGRVSLEECPFQESKARECGVHWRQLILSAAVFNAFQNTGNLYTSYWYRWETTHGKWWDRYVNSVEAWRWNRWKDDNPFLDDYVGHPMMGAITNNIWIQNDPKGMTLEQSNTRQYWRRMFRAFLFSTFYSFEWKLGPAGEAGIGHSGDHFYGDPGVNSTNETGWVELVTTPVGGMLWTLAEDALDKHVIRRLENKSRNPFALLGMMFLNPARSTANIFRFRPPWYRDSRVVKASTFWSDPPPGAPVFAPKIAASLTATTAARERGPRIVDAAALRGGSGALGAPPLWPWPGGVHEFGAWWGLSLTGHIVGELHNIKYMPIDLHYSYLLSRHRNWAIRYSPEMAAMAMLSEPTPNQTDRLSQRKRTYGSGLSPVGLQLDFLPSSRVQPFLSTNEGFVCFTDRVLSPTGSRYMYTADLGIGINIFRTPRQAVTIGYRYQHLSTDVSRRSAGTDANTFYLGASRFRTRGYR